MRKKRDVEYKSVQEMFESLFPNYINSVDVSSEIGSSNDNASIVPPLAQKFREQMKHMSGKAQR